MLIGYARVSTADRNLALQHDALHPGRANPEYAGRLTTAALSQNRTLQEGFSVAASGGTAPKPAVLLNGIEWVEPTVSGHSLVLA